MNKVYSRINWQNFPSTETPVNERNLNKLDLAVNTIDDRVITLDTTKLDKSTANTMVKDVTYNEANGIFTITYLNGVTATLDTKLEKLAVNFAYDSENERLVITLSDGTIQYVDLKALITQYDFTNSSTIAFTLGSDGKVTANIVDGSVTESKLQPNFLADCRTARQGAETASASASNSATDSANKALVAEGYANGTQNGTEITDPSSPYYHNNAKYWKEEARAIAGGGVTSFNGRSGSVVPQSGDYSIEMIEGADTLTDDLEKYVGYTKDDIYGVEVDFKNSTFTRLAGAIGKVEGSDFDSVQMFGGRRRCNVSDNGTVTAYYGDSAYREDGSNGQVMVEQPKFYYRIVPLKLEKVANGKGFHLRKARYYVSDTMKEGFKIHPAFVKNGVENNFIYLSAYEGSTYDVSESAYNTTDAQTVDFNADKLASIANAKPVSGLTQNLTRANARKIASNRGDGWSQATVQSATATEILFLIEYASFNTQSKLSIGVTNKPAGSGNESENTGATSSLGNSSGYVTNVNGYNVPSYRGEENFYGNISKWIDGINVYNYGEGTVHIADHDFEDNKKDGSYHDAGITICGSNGYVSAFAYNEDFDWLFIASECGGNGNLPVGDYFYQRKASNQYTVAILGGDWNYGSSAGGFYWGVIDAPSYRYRSIGTRLLYVPNGSKDNNIVVKGTLTVEASQNSTSAPFGIKSKNSDYSLAEYSNDAKVFGYLGMNSTSEPVVLTPNHEQKKIHHDGNSAKVVISSSAPSDTSALWVVP